MNNGWMPVALGEPPAILFWDVDEILPVLVSFICGIFLGNMLLCLLIAASYFYVMSKYKERLPKGFMINILYIIGLIDFKRMPPYLASEFQE